MLRRTVFLILTGLLMLGIPGLVLFLLWKSNIQRSQESFLEFGVLEVAAEDVVLGGEDVYRLSPYYLSDTVMRALLNNVLYGKDTLQLNPLQSGRVLKYSIDSIGMEKKTRHLIIHARAVLYPELGVQTHADEWQLVFTVHHDRPVEPLQVVRAKMLSPPIPVDQLLPFAPADPETLSSSLQPASYHPS